MQNNEAGAFHAGPACTSSVPYFDTSPRSVDLDDVHAAHLVGRNEGFALGQQKASEDLAREWLHGLACEFTGYAVSNAVAKGENWAAEIARQAAGGGA